MSGEGKHVDCRYGFSESRKSVRRVVTTCDGQESVVRIVLSRRAGLAEDAHDRFDQEYLTRRQQRREKSRAPCVVRAVDIYAGCGGLSLGAFEACQAIGKRLAVQLAVDNDENCLAVYEKNIPCQRALAADVRQIVDGRLSARVTEAEKRLLHKLPQIDLLLSGPPCQGHSDLNNHTRRSDPRNRLYARVARLVELTHPTHVMIENVPSVRHSRQGVVKTTTQLLTSLGYSVDSGVVDLSTIGVPQRRRRHVLLASLSIKPDIRSAVNRHEVQTARSIMWAIGDLASKSNGSVFDSPSIQTERNVARIAYLHGNGSYDLPNRLRPKCHRHGGHSYKSMYGRLHPDLPAQTITSGFGSPGQGRFVHPTERRTLTPHEAARLQFFPDSFDFSPVKHRSALAEMIGNAVPMKLSFVLCLHLLAQS